ncbi:hypothetical protein D3C71_1247300 [compost metagenome]
MFQLTDRSFMLQPRPRFERTRKNAPKPLFCDGTASTSSVDFSSYLPTYVVADLAEKRPKSVSRL